MIRIVAFALGALAAGPVTALSCLPPDAVTLFQMAKDSETSFYVVKGTVRLTEEPREPDPKAVPFTRTRARVEGLALSKTGFDAVFSREVMIEASCISQWCASPQNLGPSFLAVASNGEGSFTLRAAPCGGDVVPWDDDGEARVLDCYLRGECRRKEGF